jgi:hypothetical protein
MQAIQFRIARPTDKLKLIVKFYNEGLGLPIIDSFEGHNGYDGVMLGLPGSQYHLEFTQHDKGSPCSAPTKDNLIVFYFDSSEKYREATARMQSFGLSPVVPENPYWLNKSATFEDPDGWRVVLFDGVYPAG